MSSIAAGRALEAASWCRRMFSDYPTPKSVRRIVEPNVAGFHSPEPSFALRGSRLINTSAFAAFKTAASVPLGHSPNRRRFPRFPHWTLRGFHGNGRVPPKRVSVYAIDLFEALKTA
ncbi:hypothetical protein L596_003133 [Steinernema carpocapsae]|uniref:Uncharacterized protein n=1 Tax=Steinernema carpocapsae TaxID=34508 RepID=A0A4U8UVH2_STECR|nr:hypothetical protein L596_003133 [Steinernema carpocapsae]